MKKTWAVVAIMIVTMATATSCATAFWSAMSDVLIAVGDAALTVADSNTSSNNNSYNSNSSYNVAQASTNYNSSAISANSSTSNSGNYELMYRNWESRAESNYNSLMSASSSSSTYTAQKRSFTEAQQGMQRVRTEAAQHGVTIIPSKWETATVSVSGGEGMNVHKTGTHKK